MRFISLLLITTFCFQYHSSTAQKADNEKDIQMVRDIFTHSLTKGTAYDWLHFLCKNIGGRVAGSPEGAAAVEYTSQMLDSIGVDSVWLQPVEVNYWRRNHIEKAAIINSPTMGNVELSVAALGYSAPTPKLGIVGEIVEVKSLEELEELGAAKVKGKIVFFSRPMDVTKINTFHAYGGAVDQRTLGPQKASALGAIGAIVRSMTVKYDDVPHSGVTIFGEETPIPAVGMGLESADLLSALLKEEPNTKVRIQLDCADMGKKITYNVIGEIKGSTYPDEIIVVGGHIDSWDIGEGAHDDGTGCVQAMQVLQTFLQLGIRPQRTIRCVLFANEESGMAGAQEYANVALKEGEKHFAAVESDAGGHTPRGFIMDGQSDVVRPAYERAQEWRGLLAPYGLYELNTGGSAADISRLKSHGAVLFGFRPDSQRYFDYHHAETDVFENVHKRELMMGAAGMTALIYLIDKYGFE